MYSRWAPSVVPGLPPIGARGVVSLKPTPAALMLLMTIVPADAAAAVIATSARAANALERNARMSAILPLRRRRDGLLVRGVRVLRARPHQLAVRGLLHDDGVLDLAIDEQ